MVEPQVKNPDPVPNPAPDGGTRRRGVELTVTQVAASAVAAVLGAMLASGLGVYGTVIGAAVLSVVATTGGAFLQHLFDSARRPAGPRRAGRPAGTPSPPTPRPRARRRWRPRRALLAAAGVFLLAMTAVTGIELAGGSSLSGWWGRDDAGTSVGRLIHGGGDGGDSPGDRPGDSPGGDGDDDGGDDRRDEGPAEDGDGGSGTPSPDDTGGAPSPSDDAPDEDTPGQGTPSPGTGTDGTGGGETGQDGGQDPGDGTGGTPAPTPTPTAPTPGSGGTGPGTTPGTQDGGAEGATG
ncbi:hypothetical protein [Streptomyces sp. NPDC049881]|uniref:hypothetical protein n=1 Tax=Streptomyces sp. NPDC049881 TaxID=3155778 RepID=UPI0034337F3F